MAKTGTETAYREGTIATREPLLYLFLPYVYTGPMPWIKQIDPGTGEPYYYNNTTGQTQLQRPAAVMSPKRGAAAVAVPRAL